MPRYAKNERAAIAETLGRIGPDAPTLCEGWRSRDLAAHLVLRERRPIAATGVLVPPLAGVTARVQRQYADGDYPALLDQVRAGPRWHPVRFGPVEEAMNLVEFFVHHEDLRRGAPGWQPRELPAGYEAALWRRVPLLARVRLIRFPAAVAVTAPGYGTRTVGRGSPAVTLTGAPGELALFLFGRQAAADVTIDGPPDLVARLRTG